MVNCLLTKCSMLFTFIASPAGSRPAAYAPWTIGIGSFRNMVAEQMPRGFHMVSGASRMTIGADDQIHVYESMKSTLGCFSRVLDPLAGYPTARCKHSVGSITQRLRSC